MKKYTVEDTMCIDVSKDPVTGNEKRLDIVCIESPQYTKSTNELNIGAQLDNLCKHCARSNQILQNSLVSLTICKRSD